jgi:hypothetical protein
VTFTIRPISDPTRFHRGPGEPHQFRADLTDTKKLLEYEVSRLDGHHLIVELDVQPADINNAGTALRAYARPLLPGVVVAFESRHGSLVYATDRFNDWRANLRAIAKSLEALRAVDRYGVSGLGEQYTGWAQLPPGRDGGASAMTRDQAHEFLLGLMVEPELARHLLPLDALVKRARAKTHPDRHDGDRTAWDTVERAAAVLGVR